MTTTDILNDAREEAKGCIASLRESCLYLSCPEVGQRQLAKSRTAGNGEIVKERSTIRWQDFFIHVDEYHVDGTPKTPAVGEIIKWQKPNGTFDVFEVRGHSGLAHWSWHIEGCEYRVRTTFCKTQGGLDG